MLDYTAQAATAWLDLGLTGCQEAAELPTVRPLETQGDAPGLLEDLGRLLGSLGANSPRDLSRLLQTPAVRQSVTEIIAQLGLARAVRFFHWLDEAGLPDSHIIVANLIEGGDQKARAVRSAITTFTQCQVLQRLFAENRITAVQDAAATSLKEQG